MGRLMDEADDRDRRAEGRDRAAEARDDAVDATETAAERRRAVTGARSASALDRRAAGLDRDRAAADRAELLDELRRLDGEPEAPSETDSAARLPSSSGAPATEEAGPAQSTSRKRPVVTS